jgi:two-component system alkaline phosphatase synthesis response regulator PhoP
MLIQGLLLLFNSEIMQQPAAHILLAEDEEHLQEALKLNLEMEGYEVTAVSDGLAVLKEVESQHFDLIIMDIMMPELDGISTIQSIRLNNRELPILILSAKNASADRVTGLKTGADDYLTKPFNLEELLLRVEILIRRNQQIQDKPAPSDVYVFGKNRIDFKAQSAINYKGEAIALSKKEVMLLQLLTEHANQVVSREKILRVVWGYQVYPTTRTIDNFILSFRKYFEPDSRHPLYFHSIRGSGYRFVSDQEAN